MILSINWDSSSSLEDLNVDHCVILSLYPGCSILVADSDVVLEYSIKANNTSLSMNLHMNSGNGIHNTIAFAFFFD